MNKVDCDYAKGCLNWHDEFMPVNEKNEFLCKDEQRFKVCSNENLIGVCDKPVCWETYVGQQLYRLTFIDFLVQVIIKAMCIRLADTKCPLQSPPYSSVLN